MYTQKQKNCKNWFTTCTGWGLVTVVHVTFWCGQVTTTWDTISDKTVLSVRAIIVITKEVTVLDFSLLCTLSILISTSFIYLLIPV